MKKRIFSLLLVILMLVSLALVSCEDEEEPAGPVGTTMTTPQGVVIPTEKFWGKFGHVETPATTVTVGEKVTLPVGASLYGGGNEYYNVYRDYVYNDENDLTATDYYLLFKENGKTVKFTVPEYPALTGDESQETLDARISSFIFNSYDSRGIELVTVATYFGYAGEYDLTAYYLDGTTAFTLDDYGSSDLSISDYWYGEGNSDFAEIGHFIFRVDSSYNFYGEDEVKLTQIVDLETSNAPMSYFEDMSYDKNANEYYISNETGIVIFDGNLVLKNIIKYETVLGSTVKVQTLSNGNKYITETYSVPSTVEDYTYSKETTKYVVKAGIYSVADGYKAVDAPEFIGDIESVSDFPEEMAVLDASIKNILSGSMIAADKTLVSMKDMVVLDDDAKPVKILERDLLNQYYYTFKTPFGAIITYSDFEQNVVDANGAKIASLPYYHEINNKWIVTETNVYDASMNSIYEIPANRELELVMPDSIIFIEKGVDDAKNSVEKTILWTGVGQEKVLAESELASNQLVIKENYYVIYSITNDGNYNATVYASNGTELLSIVNAETRPSFNSNSISYEVENNTTGDNVYVYVPLTINK
ncbi:MAG: hypothetical protein J6A54_06065 [Clostridia bacterium]|nr:hypothetical protein [Clostridia bacterium]